MLRQLKWEIRLLLLLLLTPVLVWVYLDVRLSWEIDRELRHIRAEGYPVTPDEIKLKSVPDDQNAATAYLRLMGESAASGDTQACDRFFRCAAGDAPSAGDQYVFDPSPSNRAAFSAILQDPALSARLEEIAQASRRRECVFPVNRLSCESLVAFDMSFMGEAERLFRARGILREHEGDWEGALDDYVTVLRLAGQATRQPSMEAEACGYDYYTKAFRRLRPLLATRHLSAHDIQALRAALEEVDLQRDHRAALVAHRAAYWAILGQVSRRELLEIAAGTMAGAYPSSPLLGLGHLRRARDELFARVNPTPLARPLHKDDLLAWLRLIGRAVELADLPPRQACVAAENAETLAQAPGDRRRPATCMFGRGGPEGFADTTRMMTHVRACLIVLELQEYHSQHGNYPTRLAELGGADGAHVLEDPCTGRPFGYLKHGNGCIVYHGAPPLPTRVVPPDVHLLPGTTIPAEFAWACDYDGPLLVPDE